MKKFKVILRQTLVAHAEITVEAEDPEEAWDKAAAHTGDDLDWWPPEKLDGPEPVEDTMEEVT